MLRPGTAHLSEQPRYASSTKPRYALIRSFVIFNNTLPAYHGQITHLFGIAGQVLLPLHEGCVPFTHALVAVVRFERSSVAGVLVRDLIPGVGHVFE